MKVKRFLVFPFYARQGQDADRDEISAILGIIHYAVKTPAEYFFKFKPLLKDSGVKKILDSSRNVDGILCQIAEKDAGFGINDLIEGNDSQSNFFFIFNNLLHGFVELQY
ncbi:hypothetical protein CFS9_37650 [Flavobacterium sp. CFS9]|uniref:Uncharacterized protein n=1 Tax=Flavobacterium sp. CFS9 TaxID=3143118 RepID=A0AAT9H6J8_9FLAO